MSDKEQIEYIEYLEAKVEQLEVEKDVLTQVLLKAIMERPPIPWPALPSYPPAPPEYPSPLQNPPWNRPWAAGE